MIFLIKVHFLIVGFFFVGYTIKGQNNWILLWGKNLKINMNDVPFIGARMEKKKAERKWVISFSQVACKRKSC